MKHKIEIEIKDEVLWKGLCRLSAETEMPVSEVVERLTDVLLSKYSVTLIKSMEGVLPGLTDKPEIKALLDVVK